jgi:1-pyrroline-4-hydroxy-2-carboxylate deaminase
MKVNWRGVFPAMTTQFQSDQSLDLAGASKHVERLIKAGVHGIIMLGTVGENCSLEYSEKLNVLRAAVKQVGGRVPVLAGVAECTTALACRFAADAQRAGVDGLMVLPAMVYKSDRRETIAHFRAVARATDLPILCYNNPVSYGVDITPAMFADMADEPRFVAIKESSENVRRITDLKNQCGDRYLLFNGVDDLALESVLLGAVGWPGWSTRSQRKRCCSGTWRLGANMKTPCASIVGSRRFCTWTRIRSWCNTSSWPWPKPAWDRRLFALQD